MTNVESRSVIPLSPKKIKEIREALGMTQLEFAKELGFQTEGAVSHLEAGRRKVDGPLRKLLERIAREVGVSL